MIARIAALALVFASLPAFAGEFRDAQLKYPRVRAAFTQHESALKAQFAKAGAAWPPADLLFRVFKTEAQVETWAAPKAGAALVLVRTDPICAGSGGPGPKREEGDGQVPEGFYEVAAFNPVSSFHLSLKVNYPNASDRVLGAKRLGGDIMIHGSCVTIGCVPMTDPVIQQLYVAAVAARDAGQKQIQIHMFPGRFATNGLGALEEKAAGPLRAFWENLRDGFSRFETRHRPLKVKVDARGVYRFD